MGIFEFAKQYKTHPDPLAIMSITSLEKDHYALSIDSDDPSSNEGDKLQKNGCFSSPNIYQENNDGTKVAKVAIQPLTMYQKLTYGLDILIPLVQVQEEILIPHGSYLQKVIYGKHKKLRVIKDNHACLPENLVERKEVETYRVIMDHDPEGIQLLDPASPFMRKWDNLTLCLLVFTALVTPFETAFIASNYVIDMLFLINRFVDICFLYDMTVQIRTPFRDTNGNLVNTKSEILNAYLKGWFTIDLLSIFPFEFIGWGQSTDPTELSKLQLLRFLRLARLLKLLRVLRASRKIKRWRVQIKMKYTRIKTIMYAVIMFFLSHWIACGYRLAEAKNDIHGDLPGWLDRYALANNRTEIPTGEAYIMALYWSVSTLTLVGTSVEHLQPLSTREWAYAIFVNFLGYMLIIMFLSNLTVDSVYFNKNQREHELKIDQYLEMFYSLELNPLIKYKVHDFLTDQFAIQNETQYQSLIQGLPLQWNGLINMEIHLPFLSRIPYLEPFIDKEPGLMIDFCKSMEMIALPPNSLLFSKGIEGVYLIEKGVVAIEGKVYIRGDVFGETCLRTKVKKCEARCLTNVIVQLLSRKVLEEKLTKYKKIRYFARRWTAWELTRNYILAYRTLYFLAAERGCLMVPPMYSQRGQMDELDNDDLDLAVLEHIEEYNYA